MRTGVAPWPGSIAKLRFGIANLLGFVNGLRIHKPARSLPFVQTDRYTSPDSKGKDLPLQFEPSDQFEQRQRKLQQIQELGFDPYPREFRWTNSIAELVDRYRDTPASELDPKTEVRVAGRIVSLRLMGKAGFAHLQGAGKRLQIYVKKDVAGDR